jgi:hypothetical protein
MSHDPDEIVAERCARVRAVREWLLDDTKPKPHRAAIWDAAQALQYWIDELEEKWREIA